MADKPNIVLIFPDQHRGDVMGCAGNPVAQTPNLDRLASEGVRFPRCCTNSPLCMPARASLISGQYVNLHGVWHNWNAADRHGPSHVRNIRDSGYHTAVIGKTHLYPHEGADHTSKHVQELKDWGYEDTHEITGPIASASVDSPHTDYLTEKKLLNAYRQPIFNYVRGLWRGYLHPWEELPCLIPSEDHADMYTARKSAEWICNYKSDKPFYLQVCFPGPHDPFDSPAEYRAMYDPEKIPLAIMDTPEPPVAPYVERMLRASRLDNMTESHNRVMRTYYYGKVTLIDTGIGLILKALEDRGLMDNTWIIYTSDHGEMLGDHRLSHKEVFYEGALKIPCIIRPPKGVKGWKSKALTDQIDVAATILDIAGAEPFKRSDGRSLVQNVRATPDTSDAHQGKEVVFSEVAFYSMVLTDRYKMVVNSLILEPLELYDMVDDPNELNNLVRDPSLKNVCDELSERYISYLLGHLDEARLKVSREIVAARQARA